MVRPTSSDKWKAPSLSEISTNSIQQKSNLKSPDISLAVGSQSPLLIETQEQTERVFLFIVSLVRSLCKFAHEKVILELWLSGTMREIKIHVYAKRQTSICTT